MLYEVNSSPVLSGWRLYKTARLSIPNFMNSIMPLSSLSYLSLSYS